VNLQDARCNNKDCKVQYKQLTDLRSSLYYFSLNLKIFVSRKGAFILPLRTYLKQKRIQD